MSKTTINPLIESHTLPFPPFKVKGVSQATLELKPYIQPFERGLARVEFDGLSKQ